MVCVSLTVIMARSADLVGLFPPATAFLLLSMEMGHTIANATCLCAMFMRRTRAWMIQHVDLVIALLIVMPVLALSACVCACVIVGKFVCLSASRGKGEADDVVCARRRRCVRNRREHIDV